MRLQFCMRCNAEFRGNDCDEYCAKCQETEEYEFANDKLSMKVSKMLKTIKQLKAEIETKDKIINLYISKQLIYEDTINKIKSLLEKYVEK